MALPPTLTVVLVDQFDDLNVVHDVMIDDRLPSAASASGAGNRSLSTGPWGKIVVR